jgi:hypothetical protein
MNDSTSADPSLLRLSYIFSENFKPTLLQYRQFYLQFWHENLRGTLNPLNAFTTTQSVEMIVLKPNAG